MTLYFSRTSTVKLFLKQSPGTNLTKEENLISMYISLWNVLLDDLNVLFCDTYTLLFSVYLFD